MIKKKSEIIWNIFKSWNSNIFSDKWHICISVNFDKHTSRLLAWSSDLAGCCRFTVYQPWQDVVDSQCDKVLPFCSIRHINTYASLHAISLLLATNRFTVASHRTGSLVTAISTSHKHGCWQNWLKPCKGFIWYFCWVTQHPGTNRCINNSHKWMSHHQQVHK